MWNEMHPFLLIMNIDGVNKQSATSTYVKRFPMALERYGFGKHQTQDNTCQFINECL